LIELFQKVIIQKKKHVILSNYFLKLWLTCMSLMSSTEISNLKTFF
jgi:hypothetical protein